MLRAKEGLVENTQRQLRQKEKKCRNYLDSKRPGDTVEE